MSRPSANPAKNADTSKPFLSDVTGMNPIAAFDLWEHAYMLDFKPSQRKEYMNVVFDNINWTTIEARCA
jgi:Fe-Mn family superoxide dismutase